MYSGYKIGEILILNRFTIFLQNTKCPKISQEHKAESKNVKLTIEYPTKKNYA